MTAAPLGDNCSQLREKQDITEPSVTTTLPNIWNRAPWSRTGRSHSATLQVAEISHRKCGCNRDTTVLVSPPSLSDKG